MAGINRSRMVHSLRTGSLENQVGRTTFNAARAAHAETLAAKTGRELRAKMGWKQTQDLDEAK